ncbi:hypothetical protein CN918_27670 [Priestia megaterium]|nr:hypothetical protein CN918_27670 [Priestia megaterium]
MIPFDLVNKKIQMNHKLTTSYGKVHTLKDHLLISKGPICQIGDVCKVGANVLCEVLAIQNNHVYLLPFDEAGGVQAGDKVIKINHPITLPPVNQLLGRVLDGFGQPIDEEKVFGMREPLPLHRKSVGAMRRRMIEQPIETGIRVIDGLLTIGEGQRIGIFAGTGVGKSTMLGMVATNTQSDVNVIALIGERAREVKEFIYKNLGQEGMERSVVIVATSEESPLKQIKSLLLATTIAEQFRDKGKKVLLMVDSITRFAMAKRDLDVAAGEVIQAGGKTPSIEPAMQKVLERAGMGEVGSITGIYTVLVENDDFEAPIPDMARGILDGHIVLNRKLADQNHFPAIDILASISRVMEAVVTEEHWKLSRTLKKYYAIYKENEEMFRIGTYVKGVDEDVDKARELYPAIQELLRQETKETDSLDNVILKMKEILHEV